MEIRVLPAGAEPGDSPRDVPAEAPADLPQARPTLTVITGAGFSNPDRAKLRMAEQATPEPADEADRS